MTVWQTVRATELTEEKFFVKDNDLCWFFAFCIDIRSIDTNSEKKYNKNNVLS